MLSLRVSEEESFGQFGVSGSNHSSLKVSSLPSVAPLVAHRNYNVILLISDKQHTNISNTKTHNNDCRAAATAPPAD